MKKTTIMILLSIIVLITLNGCVENPNSQPPTTSPEIVKTYYNAYDSIDPNEIELIRKSEPSMKYDPSNSEELYNFVDIVAIATVESIDGGANTIESSGAYCYPYTYGKLAIHQFFKGTLDKDVINYTRDGGIVSYQEYYNIFTEARKRSAPKPEDYEYAYSKVVTGGDIDIEPGKTYLVYLLNEERTISRSNSNAIVIFQGGLRELDLTDSQLDINTALPSQIKVLNNYTQEWETLDTLLPNE